MDGLLEQQIINTRQFHSIHGRGTAVNLQHRCAEIESRAQACGRAGLALFVHPGRRDARPTNPQDIDGLKANNMR